MYDEAHSGFGDPWSTLLAFKDVKIKENWHRGAAEVELQLRKRILSSKSGGLPLRYFDGATMESYHLPSSAFETIYCRQEDAPTECNKSRRGGSSVLIETNKTVTYDPVTERHFSDNLFPRDNSLLININGLKGSI
jgi:hypothetical protein